MNGTPKAPDAFSAPNESQLTPTSLPSLTPPEQVPAHNGAGWKFLQGMDIAMQGHCQCLGRQMQTWKGSYPLGSRRGILPQQLVANAQPGLKRPDWRCPSSGQPQPQFPGQGPSHQQPEAQLEAQMKIAEAQLEENKKKRKRDGQRRKERKLEKQQKEQKHQQQQQQQQQQELQQQQQQLQQQLLQYQQLQQQQLQAQQLQAQQQSRLQSQLQSQSQSQGADHWSDLDWFANSGLGTAAIGNEQIDLLFDEMDGSDNTQREQIQAFDQMMMSSVPHPYIDTPEPWVPPPPTTFEDVFRQQDEEGGVELGPYSSMLFDQEHSTSSRG